MEAVPAVTYTLLLEKQSMLLVTARSLQAQEDCWVTNLQSGPLHQPLPLQHLGDQHLRSTAWSCAVRSLSEGLCLVHITATVCVQGPGIPCWSVIKVPTCLLCS